MSINYISLMSIDMVAGLFLLAAYVDRGLDSLDRKQWVPGFGMTGSIALATGLPMVLTWPLGITPMTQSCGSQPRLRSQSPIGCSFFGHGCFSQ